jgi:hypothetical protein
VNDLLGGIGREIAMHALCVIKEVNADIGIDSMRPQDPQDVLFFIQCLTVSQPKVAFSLFLLLVTPLRFAEHDREILHGDFPDNV